MIETPSCSHCGGKKFSRAVTGVMGVHQVLDLSTLDLANNLMEAETLKEFEWICTGCLREPDEDTSRKLSRIVGAIEDYPE